MEKEAVSEKDVAVESETNVEVVNPDNNQNEIGRQKEQADSARKQQTDLDGIGIPEPHNSPDVNVVRVGESMTDVRIAYYYLKDNGKIKSYYDYEKGKITREQLLEKIPKEELKTVINIEELRNHFTNCSEEEITDIISLCMKMYSSKKIEHAELVLTAPDSFRVKVLRTKDTMRNMIENTKKSLTITGYSISDYFAEMLDVIIKKSQQGVYVRIYVNDIEKQKEALDRLMSYRSRFLQIYEYQKQEDDKMAALHAKLIVSDVKKSLVSSANLSYHGMQGNIEMGFLIESHDKAKQIEEVMKEMLRMKVCGKYQ